MSAFEAIPGITKTALWSSWRATRRELKRVPRRDVLDFLEYDVDPNVWINRLLSRLRSGEYAPEKPIRYPVAKSKGFDRIITLPHVPVSFCTGRSSIICSQEQSANRRGMCIFCKLRYRESFEALKRKFGLKMKQQKLMRQIIKLNRQMFSM